MRNAISTKTQTSKVPTRVALLYFSLFCVTTLKFTAKEQKDKREEELNRAYLYCID